uniref:Cytochrome P450 n=1 Tax=Clastoptera arizonana TaxID=38151 RepID=A0A1B6E6L3_9HEMI
MEFLTLTITIILCGISGLYLFKNWLKRKRFLEKLDRIPGPPALPVIGNTLSFLLKREELLTTSYNLHRDYGPIFRAWSLKFSICQICKADYVETLLSSTEELEKGIAYTFLHPWLGTGLLTGAGSKWFLHRKLLTPSFHFAILESFVETFNEKCKIFEDKLKKIPAGSEFNIYDPVSLCTLDIICEAVMGIDMKTQVEKQENNSNANYVNSVYSMTDIIISRLFSPWLYPDFIFYSISSIGKRFAKSLKILHDFSNQVVTDKRWSLKNSKSKPIVEEDTNLGVKKKQAFLNLLLEASDKIEMLTNEEVREEVDTFMFEGHDTTTVALCWAIFLLGNHPDIQEKVYEELNSIFMGVKRKITSNDLKEMKYLERVIKEVLRLYPSVPFFDRHLKKDIKLGEYLIPAGVDVRVAVYTLHRSPEYYENPEKFDPDNFLPEKIRNRHPFAYIPFSAGSRNCIGQKFAMMELKSVLSMIFYNFRVESSEKVDQLLPLSDLILRPKSNSLKVRLYPRTLS